MRLQARQLDVPSDFPGIDFETIEARVQSRLAGQRHLGRFAGAWSAVCYRFLAMAEYDQRFTQGIIKNGPGPIPRLRFEQERDLFGFFSTGCSVIDSFSFGMFAIGAMLMPAAFLLETERDERRVDPDYCFGKYSNAFSADPILAALQLIGKNGDRDWANISKVRNILTHRVAPPRSFQVGDPTQPDAIMIGPNIALDEQTTSSRRGQIARLLSRLLVASDSFVQVHVK
jgi:hypothetical protein